MEVQKIHPQRAAELSSVWFNSLAAEPSATETGDGAPETGAGAAWLWGGDPMGPVPCALLSDPQAPVCSLPGHREKLSCIFFILTKAFLLFACIHLRVSRCVTAFCHFCWFSCWCQPNGLRMAQGGGGGEVEQLSSTRGWKGSANSRVGFRGGNSAEQISVLSPCEKSPHAAFTAYGENGYFWATARLRERWRVASSEGNTAAPVAASEQRKHVSQWPMLCPLVHNYLDYSFPNVCFRVTDRCTTYLLAFCLGAKFYCVFSVLKSNRGHHLLAKAFSLSIRDRQKTDCFLQFYTQEDERNVGLHFSNS